jgi:hypothetical protein
MALDELVELNCVEVPKLLCKNSEGKEGFRRIHGSKFTIPPNITTWEFKLQLS